MMKTNTMTGTTSPPDPNEAARAALRAAAAKRTQCNGSCYTCIPDCPMHQQPKKPSNTKGQGDAAP